MKLKDKKIIFAGCSFTYGHGLWHYTKEEGLPKDDKVIRYHEFPESLKFMEDNRFARLVSEHFGAKEISKPTTSGNDEVSLYFIRELFGLKHPKRWTEDELNYEEVSHVIFQTSFLDRCSLYENGKRLQVYNFENFVNNPRYDEGDLGLFWDKLKLFYYNEIQNLFEFLEEKNIKCYMIAMDDDYRDLIEKDEYMMKRFIEIEYDGKTFNNFRSLSDYNQKLIICNDTDFFDNPPKDLHPGLEWHRIISDSIIKKLESDLS
jgi:hypothetical protein